MRFPQVAGEVGAMVRGAERGGSPETEEEGSGRESMERWMGWEMSVLSGVGGLGMGRAVDGGRAGAGG